MEYLYFIIHYSHIANITRLLLWRCNDFNPSLKMACISSESSPTITIDNNSSIEKRILKFIFYLFFKIFIINLELLIILLFHFFRGIL